MQQLRARRFNRAASDQRAHLMREIVETLLFVGLVFIIVHFAVESSRIQDTSMEPQLHVDQLVIVNKAAYLLAGPSRGDVVLYESPADLKPAIARVVAVPGDTVTVTASHVLVNGVQLHEPYVQVPFGVAENPVVVPTLKLGQHQYFVLNDSRLVKGDSRTLGPVPGSNIVGKVVLVFWPISQLHSVSNYSNVFAGVSR